MPAAQTLFPEPPAVRRLSLVKLSALIAGAAAGIGLVAVEGEVVRAVRRGRVYFTLRDRAAEIGVMCIPEASARGRIVDGERVLVTGRLQWDNSRGQLRLVAEEVAPVGAGAIAAMLAEVRARLVADGLVGRPRRRLPLLPAVVGVICGTEAAVRADFEAVVADRFPGYPVRFRECTVAGLGAADAIAGALRELDARPEIEVIVLARGGGDATQLLPWSDEALCRAVAAARTPVVSAIGHEADRPLCDEVADLRCGTPSMAAAAVVPPLVELLGVLADRRGMAGAVLAARLRDGESRVDRASPAGALHHAVAAATNRLDRGHTRLGLLAPHGRVARGAVTLAAQRDHLEALSPQRVLERGYAVARTASGLVVRRPEQVAAGETLELTLAGGRLLVQVQP